MALLVLLVQPLCLLYTRAVMWEAAAETVRVVACARSMEVARSYALRRLDAVPEVSVFHVGGRDDWQVSAARSPDGKTSTVEVAGHLRPLPLFGDLSCARLERDATGVVLRVGVSERTRPGWVEGSYGTWMQVWG